MLSLIILLLGQDNRLTGKRQTGYRMMLLTTGYRIWTLAGRILDIATGGQDTGY